MSAVVRLGGGWRAFVRPWFRQPRTPAWNKEIYQAMLQYERPGAVGVRVDLGYLASPFGLGMMDTRPGVNTWFVQGARTLSPRWFVAGRHEGVSAPPAVAGVLAGRRSTLAGAEETVGYRLTTDVTLRGSLYQRKTFTRSGWDQQAGVSLVWARRWW